MNHNRFILSNAFYVLKYLYQQNERDREEEDLRFEEECFICDEFDY